MSKRAVDVSVAPKLAEHPVPGDAERGHAHPDEGCFVAAAQRLKGRARVIVATQTRGGAGKTTIANLLAACEHHSGRRVAVIDTDIGVEHIADGDISPERCVAKTLGYAVRLLGQGHVVPVPAAVSDEEMARNPSASSEAQGEVIKTIAALVADGYETVVVDTAARGAIPFLERYSASTPWVRGEPFPDFVLPMVPDADSFTEGLKVVQRIAELRTEAGEAAEDSRLMVICNKNVDVSGGGNAFTKFDTTRAGEEFSRFLDANRHWAGLVWAYAANFRLFSDAAARMIDPLSALLMAGRNRPVTRADGRPGVASELAVALDGVMEQADVQAEVMFLKGWLGPVLEGMGKLQFLNLPQAVYAAARPTRVAHRIDRSAIASRWRKPLNEQR